MPRESANAVIRKSLEELRGMIAELSQKLEELEHKEEHNWEEQVSAVLDKVERLSIKGIALGSLLYVGKNILTKEANESFDSRRLPDQPAQPEKVTIGTRCHRYNSSMFETTTGSRTLRLAFHLERHIEADFGIPRRYARCYALELLFFALQELRAGHRIAVTLESGVPIKEIVIPTRKK